MYFSDDGDLVGVRFDNWKVVLMEQRAEGTLLVWSEPFVALRLPKLFNLRMDPFERADVTSNTYYQWLLESGYIVMAASAVMGEFMKTFKDFPPRQKAASFTIDQAMEKMESVGSAALNETPAVRRWRLHADGDAVTRRQGMSWSSSRK